MVEGNECFLGDFELLADSGILGLYESCEITEVFLIKKGEPSIILYVLVEFCSHREPSGPSYLTDKPIKINSEIKCGIHQYVRNIEDVRMQYIDLLEGLPWTLADQNTPLALNVAPIRKCYIPADGTYNVPMNKILKNNFFNGSYILEFFDEDKANFAFLLNNSICLKDLAKKIREFVPLDLASMSDRLGSVVFQFPNLNTRIQFSYWHDDRGVSVIANASGRKLVSCCITETENTEGILGFASAFLQDGKAQLNSGNSTTMTRTIVYDQESSLILGSYHGTTINSLGVTMGIGGYESERVFKLPDGEVVKVQLPVNEKFVVGDSVRKRGHIGWARNRIYNNKLDELIRNYDFAQFGSEGGEHSKSIQHIREIINKHGEFGVYLWDPYLCASDLKKTLFFNIHSQSVMRAICSSGDSRKLDKKRCNNLSKQAHDDWKKNQTDCLRPKEGELYKSLNLEFRCKYGGRGFDFHDRFLICPQDQGECLVWSLGTSVNSLGREHHIVMKVKHGTYIMDAFNELWEQLDDDACKIWGSINA